MNLVTEKIFQPYNLANPHFSNAEIVTDKNKTLKGQFVQFKVIKGDLQYLYPSEKYCFLPAEFKKQFWREYDFNHGAFTKFPEYVMQLGLNQIMKICIDPSMIIF
jgi:hypothetical protein